MKKNMTAALALGMTKEELQRLIGQAGNLSISSSIDRLSLAEQISKAHEQSSWLAAESYNDLLGSKTALGLSDLFDSYSGKQTGSSTLAAQQAYSDLVGPSSAALALGYGDHLSKPNGAIQQYIEEAMGLPPMLTATTGADLASIYAQNYAEELAKLNRPLDKYIEEAMGLNSALSLTGSAYLAATELIPQNQAQAQTYMEELTKQQNPIDKYIEEALSLHSSFSLTGNTDLVAAELMMNMNRQAYSSVFDIAANNVASFLGMGLTNNDFNRSINDLLSQTLHGSLDRYARELERGNFVELKESLYRDLFQFPDCPPQPSVKKRKAKKKAQRSRAKKKGLTPFEEEVLKVLNNHQQRPYSFKEFLYVVAALCTILSTCMQFIQPMVMEKLNSRSSYQPPPPPPLLHAAVNPPDSNIG